jgi:hypothetical protein
MGNILIGFLCPDIYDKLASLERDNRRLRKRIRRKPQRNDYDEWSRCDEDTYSKIKTVQSIGSYCDNMMQDYMKFHINRTQATSMCITEWANTAIFMMTEFSKICQLYFNNQPNSGCAEEDVDIDIDDDCSTKKRKQAFFTPLPTFIPVN